MRSRIPLGACQDVCKRRELVRSWVAAGEGPIIDYDHMTVDSERGLAYLHGFLPTKETSKSRGKLAGSTLFWSVPIATQERGYRRQVKEFMKTGQIEVLLHGHSADPLAFAHELSKNENNIVRLAVGLMGAEDTALSDKVEPDETPQVQVVEVLGELGESLGLNKRITRIVGHSMQGNTVLGMAALAEYLTRWPNAKFEAWMPVIRGSGYDKRGDRHVYLHAGIRGAMVQLLPMLPKLFPGGVHRVVVGAANGLGVFARILGYYVRERAIAELHFLEVTESPIYLAIVNKLLRQMPNLMKDNALRAGLSRAAEQDRVSMVIGGRDTVLRKDDMIEFARICGIPYVMKPDIGHYPENW